MKLLIIEDNQHLVDDIKAYLEQKNFLVEFALNYKEAREKLFLYNYDLAVVDLGLPDGDGMELVKEIRKHKEDVAILILTATHSLEYKVKGLELGADDYLTKPFHKAELNARIHSILRRKISNGQNILTLEEIKVDINSRTVWVNGNVLNLTPKEYDLLLYLIDNENRLITKEVIAEHLWGDNIDQADNFDFIYNHIKNLRRKIIKAGGSNYIHSMYGLGYKFERKQ
ncbi:MAG: response regulator transcription factor [Bacteroidales bacterium]